MNPIALELRYVFQRISNRISLTTRPEQNTWTPKWVELPPGERFLVVAPHPDDEAIGPGGIILKLRQAGRSVRILFISVPGTATSGKEVRKQELLSSLKAMRVDDYKVNEEEFPIKDEVTAIISREIAEFDPDVVLLPSYLENNSEHLQTFYGGLESIRRHPKELMAMLYEVWTPLLPNMVVDITPLIDQKAEAVGAYVSQLQDLNFIAAFKGLNQFRATICGRKGFAEAFLFLNRTDLLKLFP